jgi:GTPase SAR1 family protein
MGALIVYDITKEETFRYVKNWIEDIKEHAEPEVFIILVGSKLDLCEVKPEMR